MKREEQVTEASEYYYNDIGLRVAFEEGAQWADEHQKSPWKDASVEKPPYDTDCDDETSVYVIVRQEQGNVLEAYYDYDNNDWRDREHNWRLQDPTHWMLIPEVPKGGEL